MPAQEINLGSWRYNLTETTQDKRTRRTGTNASASRELAGFDGRVEGGLRPLSGFKLVHTLTQGTDVASGDFYPVTLRRGASEVLSGFVYRYRVGTDGGIAFDYYRGGSWHSIVLRTFTGADTSQMDVMEFGRYCFVLRRGYRPILFYASDTDPFTINVVSDTGPGPQPVLRPYDRIVPLGSFSESSNGQIVLTKTMPSHLGLWAADPIPQTDSAVRQIEPGDYAFAFQWYNSRTGRKSSISVIAPIQQAMFAEETTPMVGEDSSGAVFEVAYTPRYAIFEGVVDLAKYDQVYLYRSVMVQKAGGTFVASILSLDGIYDVADYTAASQAGVGPDVGPTQYRRILIYYRLEDKQLVSTDWYLDRVLFDEDMPFAGAGIVYDGTAVLGSIQSPDGAQLPLSSVGEIRWSGLLEISPELFPPANRYVPRNPTDDVIRFVLLGGNVVGFSRHRIYFIRKEGGYVKVVESHDGYGAVGPHAVETVGSFGYFLTRSGVYAVDTEGQLDAVRAVNDSVVTDWAGQDLSLCSMAFDEQGKCLCLLNPQANDGRGVVVLFWMTTAKVSEVHDATFRTVRRGHVPSDTSADRRALFCDDHRRVYVMDWDRTKTIQMASDVSENGLPRVSTLDFDGDTVFTVAAATGGTSFAVGAFQRLGAPHKVRGAYVYVVGGPRHGQSARVASVPSSSTFTTVGPFNAVVGDTIVLSPVVCRWIGPQLGLVDDDGNPFAGLDHFRVRHLSSIGPAFADVQGTASGLRVATYQGHVFVGNDRTPAASAIPRTDPAVPANQYRTIFNGPVRVLAAPGNPSSPSHDKFGLANPSIYPGVTILAADFDFCLLGVQINGKIEASDQTRRLPP